MKIALFSRYFNTRNGGIGVYSKNLLRELLERGHEIDVVQTTWRSAKSYLLYTLFDLALRIPRDVEVYHALAPTESIYLPKERAVVTFHDLIPLGEFGYKKHGIGRRLIAYHWFLFACRQGVKAKRIICNSEQTKQELIDFFSVPEEKISVIRMGINPSLKPKPKRKKDKFIVGILSYLDPRKRIDILIRAFKKVNDRDAELWIGGDGIDRARLERIAKGDKRIRFFGFIPDEFLVDFYNSLDVFVFPTQIEGYGLPIIEAMACKLPVITLKDAVIPFDVKSRTYVVDKKELAKVLERREFKCDVKANYKFARLHNWKLTAKLTEEVYRDVVEG
ncbi:MAG TPA: glycosyltransferase family 1 protein [Candidatus Korarchaeota archaeon]|nr:glycosyltransferase family 1 protein [Candidatus Korarchaeota archaeon]